MSSNKSRERLTAYRRIAIALLMAAAQWAYAAPHNASGTVNLLNLPDGASQGANQSWVTVTGVTSLGSCPTNGGLVLLRMRDDVPGQKQFATLLAAKVSGSNVAVFVDDAYVDPTGFCYLLFLQIS